MPCYPCTAEARRHEPTVYRCRVRLGATCRRRLRVRRHALTAVCFQRATVYWNPVALSHGRNKITLQNNKQETIDNSRPESQPGALGTVSRRTRRHEPTAIPRKTHLACDNFVANSWPVRITVAHRNTIKNSIIKRKGAKCWTDDKPTQ